MVALHWIRPTFGCSVDRVTPRRQPKPAHLGCENGTNAEKRQKPTDFSDLTSPLGWGWGRVKSSQPHGHPNRARGTRRFFGSF